MKRRRSVRACAWSHAGGRRQVRRAHVRAGAVAFHDAQGGRHGTGRAGDARQYLHPDVLLPDPEDADLIRATLSSTVRTAT